MEGRSSEPDREGKSWRAVIFGGAWKTANPVERPDLAHPGRPSRIPAPWHTARLTGRGPCPPGQRPEARADYGIVASATADLSGIVFPYFSLVTGRRVSARLRRDNPEIEAGKEKNKYLSAYGDRKHLYPPPGAADKLRDADTPIVFVESEKGCLALTAWAANRRGLNRLAVGLRRLLGMAWADREAENANGERVDELGPISDLDCANGRKIYVLLDANSATNLQVHQAEAALVS